MYTSVLNPTISALPDLASLHNLYRSSFALISKKGLSAAAPHYSLSQSSLPTPPISLSALVHTALNFTPLLLSPDRNRSFLSTLKLPNGFASSPHEFQSLNSAFKWLDFSWHYLILDPFGDDSLQHLVRTTRKETKAFDCCILLGSSYVLLSMLFWCRREEALITLIFVDVLNIFLQENGDMFYVQLRGIQVKCSWYVYLLLV